MEYLKANDQGKESVKEFINVSRQILVSQIAINDKSEESTRLQQYISMEQEKLDLAKKQLEEDREKFEKMMKDSESNVKKVEEDMKSAI